MDNKKKIIIGIVAGIIFIFAFILNLLFPPKPFIKSAHADDAALIEQYGYFVPGNQLQDSDIVVDHLPALKGWLPEDYTYGDMLFDVASSIIGSSSGLNSETVDIGIQAIEAILDAEGFWVDTTSGLLKFSPSVHDGLVDIQVHYGYTTPSGLAVGAWYYVPVEIGWFQDPNSSLRSAKQIYTTTSSNSCFVTVLSNGITVAASYEYQAVVTKEMWTKINSSGQNYVFATYSMTCSNTYQGSESVGYYSTRNDSSTVFPSDVSRYSSTSDALAALFGWDGSGSFDPQLNGAVYIDDTIAPINILDVPGNDGRSKSINRNTDINNNIDVPYGGYNNIVLSPKLEDIPNNYEYELPIYPEVPHDLPTLSFEYPEISQNEEIAEGLEGLSPLWVTLLTMGGTFIVLKVIL